jgi:phytanoyl-CoA hydroxylase
MPAHAPSLTSVHPILKWLVLCETVVEKGK